MTVAEVMTRLEALGSEKMRAMNAKNGAGENQFGVKMGDLRTIAKEIKLNPALAEELWNTGNVDAMFLAILLMKPKELSIEDVENKVRSVTFSHLADWLNSYVVKMHPKKEEMREKWMTDSHPSIGRAAWSLTTERISKDPEGLDLSALLDRIENEMADAPEMSRWTMNFALGTIGIHHAEHRARALAIGEKLGVYKDYPCSKGCTSPYVPIWINEMVGRAGA